MTTAVTTRPRRRRRAQRLTPFDYVQAAVTVLEQLQADKPHESLADWETHLLDSVRAAASQLAYESARKPHGGPIPKPARAIFLLALASGVDVETSAKLAGDSPRGFYNLRRSDADFRQAWDDALEQSLGPIDHRLAWIALHGDPGSMATVRAAEVLARRRAQSERRDLQLQMTAPGDDGRPRTITVRMGTPLPD